MIVSIDEDCYDKFDSLLEHRHPNCFEFDENSRFFCGDSLGMIHIWDIQTQYKNISINKSLTVKLSELENDPINSIYLNPKDNSKIIVHSRDNCIKTIEYSKIENKV